MSKKNIAEVCVSADTSVKDALAAMSKFSRQIVLVTDDAGALIGAVTDGDVRRALLKGVKMEAPVREVMNARPHWLSIDAGEAEARALMAREHIHQVPLLDENRRPAGLVTIDDLEGMGLEPWDGWAVIMAGGEGRRLRPLTDDTPKPLLPVGGASLIETMLGALERQGFRRVYIAVNYLGEKIKDALGDGGAFGLDVRYLEEDRPLGTAGALSLLPETPEHPVLVMNGDILTRADLRAMVRAHRQSAAAATMGVREHETQTPYGVITFDGDAIRTIEEKPIQTHWVNAGIYVLAPEALNVLRPGEPADMTDLFARLIESGRLAGGYPIRDYWLDVGRMSDLERARGDVDGLF
ncbi:MAG: nucleotidyltransferase family protein [Rhodospirillales bacterium]